MDAGVILDVNEDDLPVVGCIHHIYVVNKSLMSQNLLLHLSPISVLICIGNHMA